MAGAPDRTPDVPPPPVPEGALPSWRCVEDEVTTPFDVVVVTVRARTLVYEDDDLRSVVCERTGVDRTGRFFLASRVRLTPTPPRSRALDELVAARSRRGFVDRLRSRGFESVERGERRRVVVGDDEATATRYDAVCPVDGLRVRVEGWLATWSDTPTDDYLLAGGAYPRELVDGDTRALGAAVDPARFREELFSAIRSMG